MNFRARNTPMLRPTTGFGFATVNPTLSAQNKGNKEKSGQKIFVFPKIVLILQTRTHTKQD